MSEWSTYRLQDFIPFSQEVYLRLLERLNESVWPLHLAMLALGLAALVFALKRRPRIACLFMAPAWIFAGLVFHLQRFAELNWAAHYFGWTFLAQAVILTLIGITGIGTDRRESSDKLSSLVGVSITLLSLVGYPLIALLAGYSWQQAEVFGIHPDPTALATLGLGLIVLKGITLWIASIIPLLTTVLSALTLFVLELPWATPLLSLLALIPVALVWKSIASGKQVEGRSGKGDSSGGLPGEW